MILESVIKTVTVYKDRALIERIATPNLTEGEHTIIFGGLPAGIDTNSLQIKGGNQAVLQDLKVKDVYLEDFSDDKKKDIAEEIEELHDLIDEINDRLNNSNEEKSLLLNMAKVSSDSSKKSLIALFVPEKMESMMKFYNLKLNTLDDRIRENKKELKKLEKRLSVLNLEMNKYNQSNFKTEKQVELNIFVKETSDIEITLSYIVYNANWNPVYDLRQNSETKKLGIAYNAVVRQSTGEKWEDVELKLSTARPQLSGVSPTLSPWFIDIFTYVAPAPKLEKVKAKAMKKKEIMRSVSGGIAPEGLIEEEVFAALEEPPMEIEEAKVESGATAVIFAIPGSNTILDNYEEHKLGITNIELETELEYTSIPKLTPFAYLTSKSKNESDYPLLAGKTNIFLDNSFVSHSNLKLVAPNEKFETSLGVDEGIKIEHKLINRFSKDEGLFSKKNKLTFEYKIEVKNNKKNESKITIKDQLPISQSQDIKVELIEPKIKENTDSIKKLDDGSVEWVLNIPAGEKELLSLKFSVEYPRGEKLTGLD
jgi:uncharacterized protein (TIGR02231 family)